MPRISNNPSRTDVSTSPLRRTTRSVSRVLSKNARLAGATAHSKFALSSDQNAAAQSLIKSTLLGSNQLENVSTRISHFEKAYGLATDNKIKARALVYLTKEMQRLPEARDQQSTEKRLSFSEEAYQLTDDQEVKAQALINFIKDRTNPPYAITQENIINGIQLLDEAYSLSSLPDIKAQAQLGKALLLKKLPSDHAENNLHERIRLLDDTYAIARNQELKAVALVLKSEAISCLPDGGSDASLQERIKYLEEACLIATNPATKNQAHVLKTEAISDQTRSRGTPTISTASLSVTLPADREEETKPTPVSNQESMLQTLSLMPADRGSYAFWLGIEALARRSIQVIESLPRQ